VTIIPGTILGHHQDNCPLWWEKISKLQTNHVLGDNLSALKIDTGGVVWSGVGWGWVGAFLARSQGSET
jgi:hypothetical protein